MKKCISLCLLVINIFSISDYASIEVIKKQKNGISTLDARITVEGARKKRYNLALFIKANAAFDPLSKNVRTVKAIIKRDLQIAGVFNVMKSKSSLNAMLKKQGAEGKSIIELSINNNNIVALIKNENFQTKKITKKTLGYNLDKKRRLAHDIATKIFEDFIGPENIFSLKIAATRRSKNKSQIVVMDFDGRNEKVITKGDSLKSSPFLSPDNKSVLYTEIKQDGQQIVEHNIQTNEKKVLFNKKGLNISPHISKDNNLYVTLSFGKQPNIYKASRNGKNIKKITDGIGFNLSPSVSDNGNELAFVSNRSGNPQIYVLNLKNENKKAKRLTFKGKYNQTPSFSPNGNLIAFTGRDENNIFDIFIIEKKTKRIWRVTEDQGRNQDPVFTPSGRYLIFSSKREGKKEPDLYISTLNGYHQYRLTKGGGYYSPAIGSRP